MMERKGGGCLLVPRSYGGASAGSGVGGGQARGMSSWQMGRIMLKFRPIAPKPVAMAPAPTAAAGAAGRLKRKAVAGRGGRRGRKSQKAVTVAPATAVQTLGEKDDSEKEKSLSSRSSSSSAIKSVDSSPPAGSQQPKKPSSTLLLMPVSSPAEENKADEPAPAVEVLPTRAAGGAQSSVVLLRPTTAPVAALSWIAVEDVTSTWHHDGEAPSSAASACGADGEAPSFVSDQWGCVTWVNAAFSRAVYSDHAEAAAVVALAGVVLPAWGTCAGFTCRVRVRHASPRRGGSVVAPCDVWRLDANGCYLWRLDLQAALTLGGGLS